MKSERGRQIGSYPSRKRSNSRHSKHAGASVGFCWGFGLVVCLTFGLASFLMFSAGHFNFSPDTGVTAAWGDNAEENLITGSLITVEVTELEARLKDPIERESQYLLAKNNGTVIEEFGPLPKYLSDYESIQLTRENDGTKLPVNEEEEDIPISHAPDVEIEQPVLEETGPFWKEHIVKSGETLSDIAKEHGNITAQDILRANGLKDANRLSENQLLLIPNDSDKIEDTLDEVRTRQMRVAATKEKVEPLKVKSYVVAQGDSLWSIANSQNIELDTLVGSNTFKTSARLRPGAILRIPNQEGIFYVMKKGETIEAVCKRYGVSINKVRQVNPEVNVAGLRTDDEIFLPGARPEGLIEHHDDVKVAEARKSLSSPAKKTAAKEKPALKAEMKAERVERIEKPAKGEVAVRKSGRGFRWPIMGRINSPFGWRQHPITRRRDFHTGIDIKAARNDPIKAAGSGKVVYSGWMGGYGKTLVIEHPNGQSTLYAHCSTLLAGKGANVSQSQTVAKIGTTGRSTGPHLHFEVRNGNSPVNPIKYLGR